MDTFDSLDFTSGQLEVHGNSTPPNDVPLEGQTEIQACQPCIIA
jgi:hypothetical protein